MNDEGAAEQQQVVNVYSTTFVSKQPNHSTHGAPKPITNSNAQQTHRKGTHGCMLNDLHTRGSVSACARAFNRVPCNNFNYFPRSSMSLATTPGSDSVEVSPSWSSSLVWHVSGGGLLVCWHERSRRGGACGAARADTRCGGSRESPPLHRTCARSCAGRGA